MTLLALADEHGEKLRTAGLQAIAEAHAAGVAVYYCLPGDNRIVKHMPDGRRFLVKIGHDGEDTIIGELAQD